MTDALSLPIAFIGLPDWHVMRWIQEHPVEARADALFLSFLFCVGMLVWAIVMLEIARYKIRHGKK